MHDIGIQCCFDPICYRTVEIQTDQKGNASTYVSGKTSNEVPLPGQHEVHVSVNAEKSKVKHDHSYAMQLPPYVIFPTCEDNSFNANSPPPLYEVEVVLRTAIEDDESVVGNENGDGGIDEDDKDDEDLDPHLLPGEEKFTDDANLLSEDEHDGDCTSITPDCEKKYLVFDSYLNTLLKRWPVCGDIKDLAKLTDFCHSGRLEVYHAMMLKYCSRREHFSYQGMVARTQLAALDNNANTGRNQARAQAGEHAGQACYKMCFP